MTEQTKGYCKYCGKEYTRGGMLRHLTACKERKKKIEDETGKDCGYFELLIRDKYIKAYWLIIEMPDTAKLSDLDRFLRDIWLECCGHLSCFTIGEDNYEVMPREDWWCGRKPKSMNYTLKKVLAPEMIFAYEYDFGSSTDLCIEVKGYRSGKQGKEKVTILSRNRMPKICCGQCGKKPAVWVNPMEFYNYNEDPFWCEDCFLKADEKGETDMEYFLHVCNSPRMGVCAYEGSAAYSEEFVPDKTASLTP